MKNVVELALICEMKETD